MRFKIDENLPLELVEILRSKGYDTLSVLEQDLGGETDPVLASACQNENRAIVTLDTDFADILTYPPENYPGIIVLRLKRQDKRNILANFHRVVSLLSQETVNRSLWIIDETRIRIRGKK
ncbi:MAG: hypothetical protein GY866_26795 [Proteobacteria bacterium]|nr:hypothetical protein [Pseudomonadota bacterium]